MIIAGIPAFNEEHTIAKVIVECLNHVDKVIVCDDGSTDLTAKIAAAMGAEVVRHERNFGYGEAIKSIFERALKYRVKALVTLDADGQHPPNEIPRLVAPIISGEADIVIGSRFLGGEEEIPKARRVGIKGLSRLVALSGVGIKDSQSGFRAYSLGALKRLMPGERGMGVSTELLLQAVDEGLMIKEVPTKVFYDVLRASTHNPFFHFFDVVASTLKYVSIRHPLPFYGAPGIASILIGIIFGFWAVQLFRSTGTLVTNLTLIAIAGITVGLILITTSLIIFTMITVIREHK